MNLFEYEETIKEEVKKYESKDNQEQVIRFGKVLADKTRGIGLYVNEYTIISSSLLFAYFKQDTFLWEIYNKNEDGILKRVEHWNKKYGFWNELKTWKDLISKVSLEILKKLVIEFDKIFYKQDEKKVIEHYERLNNILGKTKETLK